MADITHGTITLTTPDLLTPPPQAGKLTTRDIQRLARPPKGIGRLCNQAAEAIDRAGASFSPPPGITALALREAGERADAIDQYVLDLDVLRERLRQTNLIFDAEAYTMARKMNDAIKAQMKFDAGLGLIFQKVLEAFAVFASGTTNPDAEPPGAEPPATEPPPPAEPPPTAEPVPPADPVTQAVSTSRS